MPDKPLPAEVAEEIATKTEGVPLFVEELAKAVLDSGLLADRGDRWELTGRLDRLAIPATLQDSLMARLDRLVAVKDVAQTAAVIGREFGYDLLEAVADLPEDQLQDALRQLAEAGLVFRRGDPPNATYTFKHALVQETAYNALLRPRREEIHARIARTLASDFPDVMEANPELIADHYTQAGLDEEAVEFWREAGDLAVARSAPREAIAHLGHALALLERFPASPHRSRTELGLQTTLGAALIAARGFAAQEVGDAYARAQQLCQEIGDDSRCFPALFGRWIFLTARAECAEALAVADEMLRRAGARRRQRAAAARASRAEQHPVLPRRHGEGAKPRRDRARDLRAGPARRAREPVLRRSLRRERVLPGAQPDADGPSRAGAAVGACRPRAGARAGARRHARACAASCLPVPPALPRARRAGAAGRRADRACRRARPRLLAGAGAACSAATTCSRRGAPRRASPSCAPASPPTARPAASCTCPTCWRCWPRRSRRHGDLAAGQAAIAEARQLVDATGVRGFEPYVQRIEAMLQRDQGAEPAAVEAILERSIALAHGQKARLSELRATVELARLWQSQGRGADARVRLEAIHGWFTEGLHSPDLRAAKTVLDALD